jgi:hypothetical protein
MEGLVDIETGNQRQADEVKILAGFFAGEGHIAIRKGNKKQKAQSLYVEVGNTESFWAHKFQNLFGGSVSTTFPKRARALPYYHWSAKDSDAIRCLRAIFPFLLGEKRQQAIIALKLAEMKVGHTGWYTAEEHASMERLKEEMQALRRAAAETKRMSAQPMRSDSPILQVIAD